MESLFSFPVGLFHPLQHAGLARRSPYCRPYGRNPHVSVPRKQFPAVILANRLIAPASSTVGPAPATTKFREDGVYLGMNCCISSASSISQSLASRYALRKINSVR
jgi:hypothetical protein